MFNGCDFIMNNTLTESQIVFLRVLSDFINNRKTTLDDECFKRIDRDIELYASKHCVEAIVYYQLKKSGIKLDNLHTEYVKQIYRYHNLNKAINSFKETLLCEELIFFKGMTIADQYPVPALRSMGDQDVLVHPERMSYITEKLLNHNATVGEEKNSFYFRGFLFELHDSLVHDYAINQKYIELFTDAWQHNNNGVFDWNYHILYLFVHLKNHLAGDGVGFRQFMDIAILTKNLQLNWNWILEKSESIGLQSFVKTVLAFNTQWLEVITSTSTEIDDAFFIEATRVVFEDGVFGYKKGNGEDLGALVCNDGKSFRKTQIKYLMVQSFPTLKTMQSVSYCSYLKKYPLLLPFAWMHRLFYRMFDKKAIEGLKNRAFVSESEVLLKVNQLKKWGL